MNFCIRFCILALFAAAFSSTSLSAQEIPTKQKALFTKVTATWCPNCGTWGWAYMESMVGSNENDALIIGAHFSGELATAAGDFLADNFAVFGQPRFLLNNRDLQVSRNNLADKETEARNVIVADGKKDAEIGVGLEATISATSVDVKSSTKNFVALDGAYYLAIYLIENEVIANQASVGPSANHPYVIRSAFSADQFGTELFSGPVSDFSNDAEHSLILDPEWNTENLYVYGIIWKKEGQTYIYQNGHRVKAEAMSTSARDQGILSEVSIGPTISGGRYTFSGEESTLRQASLEIRDLSGKLIKQMVSGQINHGVELNLSEEANGYYLVSFSAPGSHKTVRILKQDQ